MDDAFLQLEAGWAGDGVLTLWVAAVASNKDHTWHRGLFRNEAAKSRGFILGNVVPDISRMSGGGIAHMTSPEVEVNLRLIC